MHHSIESSGGGSWCSGSRCGTQRNFADDFAWGIYKVEFNKTFFRSLFYRIF